jgi:hypothetical protein
MTLREKFQELFEEICDIEEKISKEEFAECQSAASHLKHKHFHQPEEFGDTMHVLIYHALIKAYYLGRKSGLAEMRSNQAWRDQMERDVGYIC